MNEWIDKGNKIGKRDIVKKMFGNNFIFALIKLDESKTTWFDFFTLLL